MGRACGGVDARCASLLVILQAQVISGPTAMPASTSSSPESLAVIGDRPRTMELV